MEHAFLNTERREEEHEATSQRLAHINKDLHESVQANSLTFDSRGWNDGTVGAAALLDDGTGVEGSDSEGASG